MTFRKILLLLGIILIPISSVAAGFHAVRAYDVDWNKLPVGNLIGEISEENGITHVTILMRSDKILKYVAEYHNLTTATMKNDTANGYIPMVFDVKSTLRKKSKQLHMEYDEAGILKNKILTPPESAQKRPTIPPELLNGHIDPLTAVMLARAYIKQGKTKFSLNIYDGRNLFVVNYIVYGKTTTVVGGKRVDAIHISFSRRAIAGFTTKELHNLPRESPVIDLYLSDDELMLPLTATGKAIIGSANAKLRKECQTLDECMN